VDAHTGLGRALAQPGFHVLVGSSLTLPHCFLILERVEISNAARVSFYSYEYGEQRARDNLRVQALRYPRFENRKAWGGRCCFAVKKTTDFKNTKAGQPPAINKGQSEKSDWPFPFRENCAGAAREISHIATKLKRRASCK
jgi:hypothetical protein